MPILPPKPAAVSISIAAKLLGLRPGDLFVWLSSHGWIYRRAARSPWIAYQVQIDHGALIVAEATYTTPDGRVHLRPQTLVTAQGIEALKHKLAAT